MGDLEFNLDSDTPCTSRGSAYVGILYHQLGRRVEPTQIALPGTKLLKAKEPGEVINLAQTAAAEKLGGEVPSKQLIALFVARLCMRKTHAEDVTTPASSLRMERVAAMAIAKSTRVEKLIEAAKIEKNVRGRGIGRAHREESMPMIDPLVMLPITPDEESEYPIVAAIRSLAAGPSIDKQPHIALHTSGKNTLERIVLPSQL